MSPSTPGTLRIQRETSLEDQIAVARRYAVDRGWDVLVDHLYTDAAVSGASIDGRSGLQSLLQASTLTPRPFDVVLVDDSSRIARDLADALRTMQMLKFRGVRVIYVSQGIDSASEQADSLIAMHGLVDSLYLKEMAKKIKRGLRCTCFPTSRRHQHCSTSRGRPGSPTPASCRSPR